MKTFLPNNWRAIAALYREALPDIIEAGANEWGMDPYAWDAHGIIHFTPIEEWLWSDIRACNAVLYPQFPVLRYFVDFANPVAMVAIECDGAEWHDGAKDAIRDNALRAAGWSVYRFPGWICKQDSDDETGAASEPFLRIKKICEDHGISRFSRTSGEEQRSRRGRDIGELVAHSFARGAAIEAAVRRFL